MTEIIASAELKNIRNIEHRIWDQYPTTHKPWNKANLVAVAVHPSGINTLLPLLNEGVSRGSRGVLITGDVATDIARAHKYSQEARTGTEFSNLSIFNQGNFNVFLMNASGGQEMALETTIALQAINHKNKHGNTIICCIEHDTGTLKENLTSLSNQGINLSSDIDMIFTANRGSQDTYTEDIFQKIPSTKFTTTGSVMWDHLHTEQTQEVNLNLRRNLSIAQDDIVISHYAARGHGLWSEMEINTTPALFTASINLSNDHPDKQFVLLYCFHPGDNQPEILHRLINNHTTNLPNNLKLIITEPDQAKTIDGRLVSAMANVATSACSTVLTGVSLRGARNQDYRLTGQMPIYYLSDVVKQQLAESHYDVPTPVQTGAALSATTPSEFKIALETAIFNDSSRKIVFDHQAVELQAQYRFKGTATATKRTFLQIRQLLRQIDSKI